MEEKKLQEIIEKLINEIELLIPEYKNSPEDWNISEGNVALCIISEDGNIHGKLYGNDKLRQRGFYFNAWKKASQVWITGYKTGEYEKIVFGGSMNPEDSPIALPDLIGWEGGQPITIDGETVLSFGFSGFRGFNDIKIVQDAFKKVFDNK